MPDTPNPVDPNIGARNFWRTVVRKLPLLIGGTVLLSLTTDLGFRGSLNYALIAQILLTTPWSLAKAARQFRARGAVLQDCGPHAQRWLLLVLAGGLATAAAFHLGFPEQSPLSAPGSGPLFLLCAIVLAPLSLGRLQFVENGIWSFDGLLPWDQIRAYRWTADSTLWIETDVKTGFLGPHRLELSVPPAHVDVVEAILVRNGVLRGSEPEGTGRIPARGWSGA